MSILIKGMEMPKNCDECILWDADCACCLVPSVPFIDYFDATTRLADCPLIEVPPHGRLIDADALPHYTGYALSADEVAKAVEAAMVENEDGEL